MDLSKLSSEDLLAIRAGDLSKVSTAGLQLLKAQASPKLPPMNVDPTEGISGPERFAAGAGKAVADIGRGLGQFVGLVDRADVAEARKRDAALMGTTGGTAGNIAGNVLALLPTAFIPGAASIPGAAAIGAVTGLAAPSTSTTETAQNTLLGGALGPAAIAAGRGVAAAYQGGRALLQPFTQRGQQQIAGDVLRVSATDPAAAAANLRTARPVLPGSQPTVAQVARDPGLAQLERTLLNNPEMAGPLQQRAAAQRGARLAAVRDVAGTDEHYAAINEGRRIFANEDYGRAIAAGADPQMAEALSPQIESLLRRPSIQRAQATARELAAENDVALTNFNSVEGLDWLKKALDNQISAAQRPASAIGDAELRALLQTKRDLMATLEQVAPAYREANDAYAAMSRSINSMDVARALQDKLQKAGSEYGVGGTGREMGAAYRGALSDSVESVKKSTAMDRPLSEIMPTSDVAQLENVAFDLGRKEFAETAGGVRGSPTAQNIVSQNLLRRLIGPTGLPESWTENTMLGTFMRPVQWAGRLAEPRIQNTLAEMMLDPQQAAAALAMRQRLPLSSRLGASAQPFLPQMGLNPLLFEANRRE